MNKFYIFALVLLLSACGSKPQAETISKPGTGCESLQPREADIQYALNFGKELFTEADWQRSYTVEELKAYVSWTHRNIAAIADVSMLLFCDPGGTQDLGGYFSPETLQAMLAAYDQTLIVSSCKKDDLLLYEIDAIEENVRYDIRLWAQALNETRALTVLVVFPKDENALLKTYSQKFFPQLASCP